MQNHFILTPFFLHEPAPELERLAGADWQINRVEAGGEDALSYIADVHRPLAEAVTRTVEQGERPVCIGGDCCTTIAVLAGLQRAGIVPILVWFDAHGDFNTPETTPSGFIGGMPLAMIVGRGEQPLVRASGLHPLSESDVVLADARDLDPLERIALEGSAVHHVKTMSELADRIPADRPVYVHLDVDVLNPVDAPAMLYQVAGGPSVSEFCATATDLAATRRIVAVSMTTWDLKGDQDRRTERASMAALGALIGPSEQPTS
jgi:arginase